MKKVVTLLLTLAMLLSLAACGGEEDPNAGKYLGTTAEALGITMDMSELYPGETWVDLKSGGKGTMMLDGKSVPMKWILEGNDITITIDGVSSYGSLANGILSMDLMNMGVVMTFEKEGAIPADKEETSSIANQPETLATEPAAQLPDEAGIYEGITYEYQDLSFAMSEIYDDQCTLELMGEGKAVLTLDGEVMDCTWTLDGDTFVLSYYTVASPGTMKDGQITIDYMEMGMIMTFAKTGEATPSTEEDVEITPEETANASASGFGGANTYQVEEWASHTVTTVNFTLPENMWVVNPQVNTLYVYNVESLDVAHSASPRIQFEVKENMEMVDSYVKDMTELVELDSRRIGGIDMNGRSYKLWGMVWTEYYGELPNGFWMTVRISKTSVDAGSEGSAILDSVTFE